MRRLLAGGCPDRLRPSLLAVKSNMASAIGFYQVDLGHYDAARRCFQDARVAGQDARNAACAAYAAANMSHLAFLRDETHTAMDMAAAARSLAARTDDPHLKANTEQRASSAYALDGQHGPCLAAYERAQEFLASSTVSAPGSLAYWVHEAWLDSQLSICLSKLDRPGAAVDAASNALARFDRKYVCSYAFAQVRLGAALVLSKEIGEAARVLGDVASQASLAPRLSAELRAARAGMRQWEATQAVKALDEQLAASGLVLPGARHQS